MTSLARDLLILAIAHEREAKAPDAVDTEMAVDLLRTPAGRVLSAIIDSARTGTDTMVQLAVAEAEALVRVRGRVAA